MYIYAELLNLADLYSTDIQGMAGHLYLDYKQTKYWCGLQPDTLD